MKNLFILGFEFLSYIALALVVGWYLNKQFSLSGFGFLISLFVVYGLWFFQLYKRSQK